MIWFLILLPSIIAAIIFTARYLRRRSLYSVNVEARAGVVASIGIDVVRAPTGEISPVLMAVLM